MSDLNGTSDLNWGSVVIDPQAWNLPALKLAYLLKHLPRQAHVLEIGSGEGKILTSLAKQRPELQLFGCDVRDPKTPATHYAFARMAADARACARAPYADAQFDAVLLVDVLEHVTAPDELLAEAKRVLKPEGIFLAFVPVEGETYSAYSFYRRVFGQDLYALTKDHVQAFRHAELHQLLSQYFALRELKYAYHMLGQSFDATFFAAAKLRQISEFWWHRNVLYRGAQANPHFGTRLANAALLAANALAYWESRCFANQPWGAAGVFVCGTRLI